MQDAHFSFRKFHFLGIEDVAVLEPLVFPWVVEALPLDAGHVQHVKLGHGFLQRGHFRVGDSLIFKNIIPNKTGNFQLFRGNQNKLNALVAAHGLDQGVDSPAVFQVAAQTDGEVIQPPHFPGNGQQVGKGLGGVIVAAVSGVDDGDGGRLTCHIGCALFGVAHGDDVCVAADNFGGVRHAFALGGGGRTGLAEADDASAQLQHRGLKAQAGAGGGLEEQRRQLLVSAPVPVVFRVGNDVLGGGDQFVQLVHA